MTIPSRKHNLAAMPTKAEISEVMADLGRRRWKGKTKAEKRAHMAMMAEKATRARKRKKPKKPLDT